MKIYLIRHGETDLNKARCFYGSLNVPINETGHRQAYHVARLMKKHKLNTVYTSCHLRTHMTAELIFGPDQVLNKLSDFDERGFGDWEGLDADKIQEQFTEIWEAWLAAPFEVTPPGAEPFVAFQKRVWKQTDNLIKAGKDFALVAHLGVLRLIYQRLVDVGALFWDIDFPQGTVTIFEGNLLEGFTVSLLR